MVLVLAWEGSSSSTKMWWRAKLLQEWSLEKKTMEKNGWLISWMLTSALRTSIPTNSRIWLVLRQAKRISIQNYYHEAQLRMVLYRKLKLKKEPKILLVKRSWLRAKRVFVKLWNQFSTMIAWCRQKQARLTQNQQKEGPKLRDKDKTAKVRRDPIKFNLSRWILQRRRQIRSRAWLKLKTMMIWLADNSYTRS